MRAISPAVVLGSCLATSLAGAADFRPVNGFTRVEAARLSPDGHVSVVTASADWTEGHRVYDWSPVTGPSLIGHVPATSQGNWVEGISAEGYTVVGKDRYGGSVAFRWTPAGGRQRLGTLPGASAESHAYAVSADGGVIVGLTGRPGGGGYMPFRWTEATGMEALGYLPGFTFSGAAEGIAANGQFIGGISTSGHSAGQAFRWDAVNGLIDIGDLPGGLLNSRARGISDDGAVVTGTGYNGTFGSEAFRWTAASGIVGLGAMPGAPPGLQNSEGTHISGDGATLLGKTYQGAFIWSQSGGMRKLSDVLAAQGAINLAGWRLERILDVSHDGTRILGLGNNGLFLADLEADPVLAPPEAVDDGPFTAVEGVPVVIGIGGNDLDFIGPVTVALTTLPTKGTIAAISPPGPSPTISVTYTADMGATGADSFVYSLTDGTPTTDSATVFLNVTPQDPVPDDFSFTDRADVPPGTVIESEAARITGINMPTAISVVGGEYSVDYGEFTNVAGTISDWSLVVVRHTSSAAASTSTSTVLTVGGVSAAFTSTTAPPGPDTDGDGVSDQQDNCLLVVNPVQCDSDEDGYGNHCDGDLSGNGDTNAQDTIIFRNLLGAGTPGPTYNLADLNCNGVVNAQDTALFRQLLGQPPGPSGQVSEN